MAALVHRAHGLLLYLALVYWVASLLVLVFRLAWPDFEQLTAYGGRNTAAVRAPDTQPLKTQLSQNNKLTDVGKTTSSSAASWSLALIAPLRDSPLGRIRVTRQQSFSAFYVTGVTASGLLFALQHAEQRSAGDLDASAIALMERWADALPLLLFALHCSIRLAETRYVQRFRCEDTVTLFAAVAGCTFYAMAAVSSTGFVSTVNSTSWSSLRTEIPSSQRALRGALMSALAVGHIALQAVQVMVHTTLAGLPRQGLILTKSTCPPTGSRSTTTPPAAPPPLPPRAEVEEEEKEAVWRYVQAVFVERGDCKGQALALHGPWRCYHFPYQTSPFFRVVLDPHYTCEVLLYAVNTALLALCFLSRPASVPGTASSDVVWWLSSCSSAPGLYVAAAGGVTLFTVLNLSITAAEHRRFWIASNAARRAVADVISSLLLQNSPPSSAASKLPDCKSLPLELRDAAARFLAEHLTEEVLPRWNVVPFIW